MFHCSGPDRRPSDRSDGGTKPVEPLPHYTHTPLHTTTHSPHHTLPLPTRALSTFAIAHLPPAAHCAARPALRAACALLLRALRLHGLFRCTHTRTTPRSTRIVIAPLTRWHCGACNMPAAAALSLISYRTSTTTTVGSRMLRAPRQHRASLAHRRPLLSLFSALLLYLHVLGRHQQRAF